jgi:hypothetical protein
MPIHQIENPGSTAKLEWSTLLGKLVLITADHVEREVKTVHGLRDVTVGDVHVLDGQNSELFADSYIWPGVLQGQLKNIIGTNRGVLGRVEQGRAAPGQNPPWRLATPTAADREVASKYLDSLTDDRFAPADAPF